MRAIAEEALVGRGEDAAIPCFDLIRDDNRVAEEVRPSLRKTRRTSRGEFRAEFTPTPSACAFAPRNSETAFGFQRPGRNFLHFGILNDSVMDPQITVRSQRHFSLVKGLRSAQSHPRYGWHVPVVG